MGKEEDFWDGEKCGMFEGKEKHEWGGREEESDYVVEIRDSSMEYGRNQEEGIKGAGGGV